MPIDANSLPMTAEEAQQTFDLAKAAFTAGHWQEACRHYQLLVGYFPDSPFLHYNLGLTLYEQAEYQQAVDQFSLTVDLSPEDPDALFNLALSHKKNGDIEAAIVTYGRVLHLKPKDADSLYNLAGCYRDQDDDDKAIDYYQQVLELEPADFSTVKNLAYVCHRAGENDMAIRYYTEMLKQKPDNESVRYLLDALKGTPIDHAPDSYVRSFFNSYARSFEHDLVVDLGYDNPRQLYACLGRSQAHDAHCAHGLDLGCGTGLNGMIFRYMVDSLDGVDLSEQMLLQAREKHCYAVVHQDSILHHLTATQETYDLFLATDVFIYVGDLLPIFTLAHAAARPEALFCFSTEHLEGEGYKLLSTGRFAYSYNYIRQMAMATGWLVLSQESAPLRLEREDWLTGDLWILRRQAH